MMLRFIDAHRDAYGVEPICDVLPIAPSLYYEWRARQRDPERRPRRARRDDVLSREIRRCGTRSAKSTECGRCGSTCGGKASPWPAAPSRG
jgi:hypothetical protein